MAISRKNTNVPTESDTVRADGASNVESRPGRARRRRRVAPAILAIAFLLLAAYAYKLYQENLDLRNPQRQIQRVVADMEEHIILPQNEVPGVFPIDKKTATEPFFQNAETGDLLVVYRTTNQAFIWSPKRGKLVNAGVLIVDPQQQEVNAQPQPEPAAEVEEPEEEQIDPDAEEI